MPTTEHTSGQHRSQRKVLTKGLMKNLRGLRKKSVRLQDYKDKMADSWAKLGKQLQM